VEDRAIATTTEDETTIDVATGETIGGTIEEETTEATDTDHDQDHPAEATDATEKGTVIAEAHATAQMRPLIGTATGTGSEVTAETAIVTMAIGIGTETQIGGVAMVATRSRGTTAGTLKTCDLARKQREMVPLGETSNPSTTHRFRRVQRMIETPLYRSA
jgi:hypothetical protein